MRHKSEQFYQNRIQEYKTLTQEILERQKKRHKTYMYLWQRNRADPIKYPFIPSQEK